MNKLYKIYKKWRVKRKEVARQKIGEWLIKIERIKIDKIIKDIDLELLDK